MTALFLRICPDELVSVVMQVSFYFQPIKIEVKRWHADYYLFLMLIKAELHVRVEYSRVFSNFQTTLKVK